MIRIITVMFLGFFLMGCVSEDAAPPSAIKAVIKNIMEDTNSIKSESTLQKMDTPEIDLESDEASNGQMPDELLPGVEVFAFEGGEPGWYTVDDDVMGGVSQSRVEISDESTLIFSGTMSLQNNGGFSSARSDWVPINLSDSDGVLLRVLGDGKTYRLRIRSGETGGEISYNAIFETAPGAWKIVYIPFAGMVPTYRGFLMDVGPLQTGSIGSFGFMLSDEQPGDFELQVDWIRAISEDEIPITGSN